MYAELRGVQFRPADAKAIVEQSEVGDEVELEREPGNEYDPNAIKVLLDGTFVGYVAKEVAAEIADRLDNGDSYTAFITGRGGPKDVTLEIEFGDEAPTAA